MSETQVMVTREGAVLVVTLDGAASRNSISLTVYLEVQAAIRRASTDPEVRAIVLTGAGGFFSSGGNISGLKESGSQTMAEATAKTDALGGMIKAIRACPKPVVAAVEGGAAGAGASLALACDLLVAAQGAKFIAAYVKIGLTPDGGLTHFLGHALPRQLLAEMTMLGAPMPAERLAEFGVVNRVTETGGALAEAMELARKLAAGPAQSLAQIKALVEVAPETNLARQLDLEAEGMNAARFRDEAAEGLAAFLEKRRPNFP